MITTLSNPDKEMWFFCCFVWNKSLQKENAAHLSNSSVLKHSKAGVYQPDMWLKDNAHDRLLYDLPAGCYVSSVFLPAVQHMTSSEVTPQRRNQYQPFIAEIQLNSTLFINHFENNAVGSSAGHQNIK